MSNHKTLRDVPWPTRVVSVTVAAVATAVVVALLALAGRAGFHAFLWLWHRA